MKRGWEGAVSACLTVVCPAAQAAPDFVKDVRPILERSCYGCHGPEKQEKEAPANSTISGTYRLLLQRGPNADELTRFTAYAQKHGLSNAVHVIINSNEFLYPD